MRKQYHAWGSMVMYFTYSEEIRRRFTMPLSEFAAVALGGSWPFSAIRGAEQHGSFWGKSGPLKNIAGDRD
jgi:hypothetical protein